MSKTKSILAATAIIILFPAIICVLLLLYIVCVIGIILYSPIAGTEAFICILHDFFTFDEYMEINIDPDDEDGENE